MEDRHYKCDNVATFNVSGVIIPADCAAIEFYCDSSSTADAFINGRRIPVGDSWSPSDHKNEHDDSQYLFTFTGPATCLLVVTRKKYQ
jgi:hypothetical protein